MKIPFIAAALFSLLLPAQTGPQPANPETSPEARALLKYIQSISGKYTLSGQHNYPATISRWSDRAFTFTGKYPAVFGQDFGFQGGEDKDSVEARPVLVEECKQQYLNGAVVTLTWHALRPTQDEPVTFMESVQGKLTDYEWQELLTPGTKLYNRWCVQVDEIAGYLRQLRDAHVPILWRPYHEVNGGWFWWGGRKGQDGSAALYRQLYDRFVKVHHLNNLIWVWNANAPSGQAWLPGPCADFFPGVDVVDILSMDIYNSDYKQSHYDDLLVLAQGKPIALGEVGTIPTLEILKQQPKWTWYMTWSEHVEIANSRELVKAVANAPTTLNRDDPKFASAMKEIRKPSAPPVLDPVTPKASSEAKALLARLQALTGKGALLGQTDDPASPARLSSRVFELTRRHPAIYAQDLAIPKVTEAEAATTRQAILEEAKRQKGIVSLEWRPLPPSGKDWDKSLRAPLSDYEWNDLLTPGTRMNLLWCSQVDVMAATLKALKANHVPVLWRPYPQANAKTYWWGGRKGTGGSAALYRQLQERLVRVHGLDNLVWVWNAAAPGFGPNGPGRFNDFFPGLLFVDVLALDVEDGKSQWPRDAALATIGLGKPVGLNIIGKIPSPELLTKEPRWSWLLISTADLNSPEQSDALGKLYAEPKAQSLGQ